MSKRESMCTGRGWLRERLSQVDEREYGREEEMSDEGKKDYRAYIAEPCY